MIEEELTEKIIGAAIEVHGLLGAGLLESAYEECFCRELDLRGLVYRRQVMLPVVYKGHQVDASYRLDLLVENTVVVELKCIDKILPIHESQLLTYLRLSKRRVGLVINFNVRLLKDGILRRVR